MLQRIQTVYLFLAFIATIVCLSMPVGFLTPQGMGGDTLMYNLCLIEPAEGADFSVWPLFALLIVTCPICLVTIFAYSNRMFQSKLCMVCILLCILWLGGYAYYGYGIPHEGATFRIAFPACLPLINIILYALARRGIISDEKLVRSENRIR